MKSLIKLFEEFTVGPDGQLSGSDSPKPGFDFENYDDSDISGPGLEMMIQDVLSRVNSDIMNSVQNEEEHMEAKAAIAELFISTINQWANQP